MPLNHAWNSQTKCLVCLYLLAFNWCLFYFGIHVYFYGIQPGILYTYAGVITNVAAWKAVRLGSMLKDAWRTLPCSLLPMMENTTTQEYNLNLQIHRKFRQSFFIKLNQPIYEDLIVICGWLEILYFLLFKHRIYLYTIGECYLFGLKKVKSFRFLTKYAGDSLLFTTM